MTEHTCGFQSREAEAEELFSGYLDDVLTQADRQRVRVRLESCAGCRQLVEELRTIRKNARETRFSKPAEADWPERPATKLSGFLRTSGWTLLGIWLILNLVLVFAHELVGGPGLVKVILGTSVLGWLLLLVSVLLDRVKDLKGDRYRSVSQ